MYQEYTVSCFKVTNVCNMRHSYDFDHKVLKMWNSKFQIYTKMYKVFIKLYLFFNLYVIFILMKAYGYV